MSSCEAAERTVHGYLSDEDKQCLSTHAKIARGPIVEIGAFQGLSTCVLAENGWQPIFSVDPHADCKGINGVEFGPHDRQAYYENIYVYGDRVRHLGIGSLQASTLFDDETIGLVFIDGEHRMAMQDVQAWLPKLKPNGIMLMHDCDLQSVAEAIAWATQGADMRLVSRQGGIAVLAKHPERIKYTEQGQRLCFVHIPRTGGHSVLYRIERAVSAERTHSRAVTLRRQFNPSPVAWDDMMTFAVLRHPVTRMLSAWHYLRNQQPWHRFYASDYGEREWLSQYGDTFADFVHRVPISFAQMGTVAPHFVGQHHFVCDESQRIIVSMLLRFENLADELRRVLPKPNRWAIPHNNASQPNYEVPSKTVARIRELYAVDYKLFAGPMGWD